MRTTLLVSCEHATNAVPAPFRAAFRGARSALDSHRGWDPGALVAARAFARAFDAPLFAGTATRLLVDLNRSLGNPGLLSEWSAEVPDREGLVDEWWRPHRSAVEDGVRALLSSGGRVLHLSVHSFTPVWKGVPRDVDVGFLLDPARPAEGDVVERWRAALARRTPELRLRRNRPYRGTSDGFTTHLRKALRTRRYLGLELELSQAISAEPAGAWAPLRRALVESLREVL